MAQIGTVGHSLRPKRALDFGCGVGRISQPLPDRFERVDGVDIAESTISRAREYNSHGDRCVYHVNPLPDLRLFSDETFDFVYSTLTLQHMPVEYVESYIAEFLRVARTDGIVVFQLPSRRLPLPLVVRAKTWLHSLGPIGRLHRSNSGGIPIPSASMYPIERREVSAILARHHCRLVAIREDRGGGESYESFRYFVTRQGYFRRTGSTP